MRPIRFLHAADLHLDSPFKGHVDRAGAFAPQLLEATFATFARIIDTAIAERVDFVLLAGDLYDARDRSLRAQLKLRDGLARLDAAGIPSFVVHGNHDPLSGKASQVTLPKSAHVFGGVPETARVEKDGETIASVTGVSYARSEITENLARTFPKPPDAGVAIALLHANLGGDAAHANYAPCTLADLDDQPFHYWALGHVHQQAIHKGARTTAAYPGNPQGRSVRETGPRGCLLVEIDGNGTVSAKSRVLDEVRWHRVSVSIDGLASVDALEERVAEEIRSRVSAKVDGHEPGGHVFRLELTGRGAVHGMLSRRENLDDLTSALARKQLDASTARRFVLVESVSDSTGRAIDRAAIREQQTILGDALRLVEELKDPAAESRTRLAERLDPLEKRLRGVLDEERTDADLLSTLERASEIAIDQLDEDPS